MNGFPGRSVSRALLTGAHSRRDLLKYSAALGACRAGRAICHVAGLGRGRWRHVSLSIAATPTHGQSKPDWVGWWGTNYLYDTLLTIDDNEALAPLLAESWETRLTA